jgi:hypothetical protein
MIQLWDGRCFKTATIETCRFIDLHPTGIPDAVHVDAAMIALAMEDTNFSYRMSPLTIVRVMPKIDSML